MKKTFIIIYSIIVSLVLISSLTFFGVNLYNENAHGELRTQVKFSKVSTAVSNALKKDSSANAETMRQIENAIGDTKDFSYLKITVDSKTIYVYPTDFDSGSNVSSNLVIPYSNKLTTSDNRKVEIIAGMYSLRPTTIYSYAKITFFVILIVALLTIILIIYNNHFSKDTPKRKIKKARKITFEDTVDEEEDSDEEESYTEEEDYEEEAEPEEEAYVEEEVEEAPAEEKLSTDYGKMETPQLPVKELEPVELEEAKTEQGLFSPDTGLGWESYLLTRLDNELNRATASELDLALFIIKLGGLNRSSVVVKKICEYLTVEFQFKDLLFEYKNDSICGIKISMNIDNAITFAEKLVDEIKAIAQSENANIFAGITTRGIRMVTGERLLKEADEALKHAEQDKDCPVVGFRADAVKYRKFIETK